MNHKQFDDVLKDQIEKVVVVLGAKSAEYSSDADKLHNFKLSATLQNLTPIEALRGKMAKHTVSIYDMINSGHAYPLEVWDEKITDHINYLILLRALVIEEDEEDAKLGTGSTD